MPLEGHSGRQGALARRQAAFLHRPSGNVLLSLLGAAYQRGLLLRVPPRKPLASSLRYRARDVLAASDGLEFVLTQMWDQFCSKGEWSARILCEVEFDLVGSSPFAIHRDRSQNVFAHISARADAHDFILLEAWTFHRGLSDQTVAVAHEKKPLGSRPQHRATDFL
jgi:hypothetical protein